MGSINHIREALEDMQVLDHGGAPQIEEVLVLPPVARPVALRGANVGQTMFPLHPLMQRCWVTRRSRSSSRRRSSGWIVTLRFRPLFVHCARSGQATQVAAGRWTVSPGTKGIST